jgi:hypothetical protein
MLLREFVEFCSSCEDLTSHTRRTLALPLLLCGATLGAAGLGFLLGGPWRFLGAFLLWVAWILWQSDRERCWKHSCNRCREKARAEWRRAKPTLDGNTEIMPW